MSAVAPAFAAGALGAAGVLALAAGGGEGRRWLSRAPGAVSALVEVLLRLGAEGRDPAAAERRRLLLAAAGLAFALGAFIAGPAAGAALGAAGPWLAARLMRARRERYRRAVESRAALLATTLADSLGAGRSLRTALAGAPAGLTGAARHELERVAAELRAGARTEDALEAMGTRLRSGAIDTLVAACLVQRRAGGDLARLLRDCAEAFGDQARLAGEARAATAQARFTGAVVVLMPVGGALLAELASPGFLARLAGSPLTGWLAGLALSLQVGAAFLIRRLGRVRW